MNPTMPVPPEVEVDARQERRRGMRLGSKLHLLQIPIGIISGAMMAVNAGDWRQFPAGFWMSICSIGFNQFLYMVPVAIYLRAKGKKDRAKGIGLCAIITFLLNVSIVALLFFYLCGNWGK
jgi:hypothetical protein